MRAAEGERGVVWCFFVAGEKWWSHEIVGEQGRSSRPGGIAGGRQRPFCVSISAIDEYVFLVRFRPPKGRYVRRRQLRD